MKLTKDTLIEGKVIKEGTAIEVGKVTEIMTNSTRSMAERYLKVMKNDVERAFWNVIGFFGESEIQEVLDYLIEDEITEY